MSEQDLLGIETKNIADTFDIIYGTDTSSGSYEGQWGVITFLNQLRAYYPHAINRESYHELIAQFNRSQFSFDISDFKIRLELESAYAKTLSECSGVEKAFITFNNIEDESEILFEANIYFFVTEELYLNISELYEITKSVKNYFQSHRKVLINYHFSIFNEHSVKEMLPKGESPRELRFQQFHSFETTSSLEISQAQ